MTERGLRADHFLERTAVARAFGFFWLARAVKPGPIGTIRTSPSSESHPARGLT